MYEWGSIFLIVNLSKGERIIVQNRRIHIILGEMEDEKMVTISCGWQEDFRP